MMEPLNVSSRSRRFLLGLGLSLALVLWSDASTRVWADAAFDAFERGDYETAFEAWSRQAERGNKNAQFYLGYLYDSGQGVAEDNATAAAWYRKAAVQGVASAQYNLAAMYTNGDGVAQDYVLAYMLFDLASEKDSDGATERDALLPLMTPLEIARANRLSRLARGGDMNALLQRAEGAAFAETGASTTASWNIFAPRDLTAMAQRALAELGYDPGPADGLLGTRTEAALRAFQTQAGLPVDGQVDDQVLDALYTAFDSRLKLEEIPYGKGRLWKIERGEAEPSYLFGTFHTNNPDVLDLPRPLTRAFFRADIVALELEIYSQSSYNALSSASVDSLVIDDGRTLRQIVGKDIYSDVVAALTPFGVQENVLQLIKPWGIYHLLTATAQGTRRARGGGLFLDLWLGQKAVHHGKRLVGLESIDEQIGIFAGLSEQEQVELLDSAIALSDEGAITLDALKDLYLKGDLTAIFRKSVEPARRLGPKAMLTMIERLLDDRNKVMVERMTPLLQEGNAFVAVGAAHLPGQAGILQLLVDQGYKVTNIL